MKVTAIKHTDVRGKILHYVKITKADKEFLINVGEKTYQAVKAMEEIEGEGTEIGEPTKEELKADLKAMEEETQKTKRGKK